MPRRVVVTGMGLITPAGIGVEKNWQALMGGKSGIDIISSFDASNFPTKIAGEIKDFRPQDYIKDRKTLRTLRRGDDFGLVAAMMAVGDAGLEDRGSDITNGGIYLGCGKEISSPDRMFGAVKSSISSNGCMDYHKFGVEAMKQVYPLCLVEDLPNICLYNISKTYKLQGINNNIISSGTASSQAIGDAFRAIQWGDSDFIIAGGFDARVNPINLSYFSSVGLLSRNNSEPEEACRPFDFKRDGFVLGEGAGIIILEELNYALKRGAKIHGELIGYAAANDGYGFIKEQKDHITLKNAITKALENAGINPQNIDYIKANGDATISGDKIETLAIKEAMGDFANKIPVSSIKPIFGHLIAASGAVELIATILAVKNNKILPTINYKYQDSACDLDYVPNKIRDKETNYAISINRDAGGKESVLVVKRFD